MEINYLAVLVAAVLSMAAGAFWYSPAGFGNIWAKLSGMKMPKGKMSEKQKRDMMRGYALGFVMSLVIAYVMAHFVNIAYATTPAEGAQTAFWAWLGFCATIQYGDVLWMGHSHKLFAINASFRLVQFLLSGIILAAW